MIQKNSRDVLNSHGKMKALVKEKALNLLKIDNKLERLEKDIDNGDTNIFFLEMFGKNVMFVSKLMTSLQTTFGMSFYEQISKELALISGYKAETQYKLSGYIHPEAKYYLDQLLEDNLYSPNRINELQELAKIYMDNINNIGEPIQIPDSTVDVFIKKPDGTEIFIDITTVKPNKKEFRALKQKILKWFFLRLSHGDIEANRIQTYIAIPYNPESTINNDYNRWNNYYDRSDLLVGDELWRLVSNNIFSLSDMVSIFREIGIEYKEDIKKYFPPND